ncbi:EAL domain, c-di-GMP-specific phosphodiesterase class I (or its enzymatically inactive variant) [Nitrosospira multiformis]|uniref:EAL domain, c-di-GMP-specific phosphodiesterase class I (Or its enzymatically inactive variant) n=1 Tax=Nitrosospira multiformis TaxID=1231 RepID=A0A1H8IHH2_9PROT|nr:EAL domain-containing response regulator [Nitrosospira multiformis]SEN67811.1 EAL domain, c-di-GMP-specific phosphodiesterase class I (or its enzymatically inactive variant) [Nitrosospira multiformis]
MVERSAVKILVLDDETFMLKLLNRILSNLGYSSVTLCDSGRAALEKIASTGADTVPNVILLDLNMPEMDGIEFVRHLVDLHYLGSLILVSGEDERILQTTVKLVRAHKIPILGYLHKPVKPDALSELLESWAPSAADAAGMAKKVYTADELRAAIEGGQLVNYYQPKVVVATGEVVGVETLARWRHPADGIVFPDQFIGVAEAAGLIDDLTKAVFAEAMAQAKLWQEMQLPLRVAVNVSMDNLASLDFLNFVAELAAKEGIAPQNVVLEVTETKLMQDTRAPLEILTRLRLKRFRLSIDDFGTGHSSLAQLRDIPFDELKIDQGFVHHAGTDETLRAIYDASLSLARQLNMEVVAEGVQDREDWDLLRRTGCDLAQGAFVSSPMLPEDVLDWIELWRERVRTELFPTEDVKE